jgi:hypothetical protein
VFICLSYNLNTNYWVDSGIRSFKVLLRKTSAASKLVYARNYGYEYGGYGKTSLNMVIVNDCFLFSTITGISIALIVILKKQVRIVINLFIQNIKFYF